MIAKSKTFHIVCSGVFLFQIIFYFMQAYRFGLGAGFFAMYSLLFFLIYFGVLGFYLLALREKKIKFRWVYLSLVLAILFAIQLAFWLGRWTLKSQLYNESGLQILNGKITLEELRNDC